MQDDELEKSEWERIHRTLNGEYNEMKERLFYCYYSVFLFFLLVCWVMGFNVAGLITFFQDG